LEIHQRPAPAFNLDVAPGAVNLLRMNKFARLLYSTLAAAIAGVLAIFVTPSPPADPPELDCTGDAPCTAPQLFALPQDGPDGGADIGPPPTKNIVAASGPATPLPPLGWMNETMTMLPRRPAWRPPVQASDDGWLAYAAMHAMATAAANSG
jgi:hypothetical protein